MLRPIFCPETTIACWRSCAYNVETSIDCQRLAAVVRCIRRSLSWPRVIRTVFRPILYAISGLRAWFAATDPDPQEVCPDKFSLSPKTLMREASKTTHVGGETWP